MNDQNNTNTSDSPADTTSPASAETESAPIAADTSSTPGSWKPSPAPAVDSVSAESSATPTPPQSSPSPKKSSLLLPVLLLVGFVLIVAAAFVGYSVSKNKADKDVSKLNSQITSLKSNEHELPAGAIKVSECIPNMGSHYLPKDADPEYGPFVLVTKAGKVIGLEYMASQDMYTAIPKTDPPVQLITKGSPLYGWKFDHTEFSHLPKGHEGLLRDHTDVHLFTVSADEVKKSCV